MKHLVLALLLTAISLSAQDTWSQYERASLNEIAFVEPDMTPLTATYPEDIKFLVKARYLGKHRKISTESSKFISGWLGKNPNKNKIISLYKHEVLISEGSREFWMPIQTGPFEALIKEVREMQQLDLFVYRIGALGGRWTILINEYDLLNTTNDNH